MKMMESLSRKINQGFQFFKNQRVKEKMEEGKDKDKDKLDMKVMVWKTMMVRKKIDIKELYLPKERVKTYKIKM